MAQSLQISTVSPDPNSVGVGRSESIIVDFSNILNPSTVDATSFRVYGRWSGPMSGQFVFTVSDQVVEFIPDEPFFAGEQVIVSLGRTILDNIGNPLATGYQFQYWTAVSGGSLDLSHDGEIDIRESGEGSILAYGAYAGDFDNDGWSDLLIPNEGPPDFRVFLNDAAGDYSDFTIYQMPSSNSPSANEGADFNNDGEIDIAIGSGSGNMVSVFMGTGTGTFDPEEAYEAGATGSWIRGVCVADLDGDNWDDLIATTRDAESVSVLLNDGDGTFGIATSFEANGSLETSCATADVNADGIMDVFVGSYSSRSISLMLGDGDGNLVFSDSVSVEGQPWMSVAGDLDGDLVPDVITAGFTGRNISVVMGNADGTLGQISSYESGDAVIAVDLGDLDADGDLDVVVSNLGSADWSIFENDGAGNLTLHGTLASNSAGSCAILHDRDNDGDLDVTGIDETEDVIILYKNPSTLSVEGLEISLLLDNSNVVLSWSTLSETDNVGFDVQRQAGSQSSVSTQLWETIGFVDGHGTTVDPNFYRFIDTAVEPGDWSYRLRQVNSDGSFEYSDIVDVELPVIDLLSVQAPYPNPFVDETSIHIIAGQSQRISVTLFDITGRIVSRIDDRFFDEGEQNTYSISSTNLAPGAYFVRVMGSDLTRTFPVILSQ